MGFEDYNTKESVVLVYTGDGKGKTSASLGLMARALGNRWNVAFIQFIKYWGVSEHVFIRDIQPLYKDQLYFYKGGKGFYNAGDLSPQHISKAQHKAAAIATYKEALKAAASGHFELVICDEINNAVHDGLLSEQQLKKLMLSRAPKTSLCFTGRNFPKNLLRYTDIDSSHIAILNEYINLNYDEKKLATTGRSVSKTKSDSYKPVYTPKIGISKTLPTIKKLKKLSQDNLLMTRNSQLTGRNSATEIHKLKHHFDDKFLANKGIDF